MVSVACVWRVVVEVCRCIPDVCQFVKNLTLNPLELIEIYMWESRFFNTINFDTGYAFKCLDSRSDLKNLGNSNVEKRGTGQDRSYLYVLVGTLSARMMITLLNRMIAS